MAEKQKRALQWGVRRKPGSIAPILAFMRFFTIRRDAKDESVAELLFQESSKLTRSLRVIFDLHFLAQNSKVYTDFLATIDAEPNDAAQDEQIPYPGDSIFSNFLEMSRSGQRAETTFGLVNLHDIGELATGKRTERDEPFFVDFWPVVTIYSNLGFQLKLVSELIGVIKTR